ncbi:MAG: hypothetical protein U1F51_20095 [Burkholderiales bacterium]
MNDAHVLVAIASIDGRVALAAAAAILDWARSAPRVSLAAAIAPERTHARNALVSAFHADRTCSHLFLLDPDLVLPPDALARLVGRGRDVVAVAVPLGPAAEARSPVAPRDFDLGPVVGEDGPLFIHERASASALLVSRRAVDALVDDAKRTGRVYAGETTLVGSAGVAGTPVHYECFRAGARDGEWRPDDADACAALRRAGMPIHVDATIVARRHAAIVV